MQLRKQKLLDSIREHYNNRSDRRQKNIPLSIEMLTAMFQLDLHTVTELISQLEAEGFLVISNAGLQLR